MEEERRAACAEKLKRLDEKQQQQQQQGGSAGGGSSSKTPSLDGNSTTAAAGSPSPCVSASSPNISQPPSPCVDTEEPPVLTAQPGPGAGGDRQRASSNSSHDSGTGECFTDRSLAQPLPVGLNVTFLFFRCPTVSTAGCTAATADHAGRTFTRGD